MDKYLQKIKQKCILLYSWKSVEGNANTVLLNKNKYRNTIVKSDRMQTGMCIEKSYVWSITYRFSLKSDS